MAKRPDAAPPKEITGNVTAKDYVAATKHIRVTPSDPTVFPDGPTEVNFAPPPSDAAPVAWRVEVEKEGDEIIGPVRLFTGPGESWEIQGVDEDCYEDEAWAKLLCEKHNATLYAHPEDAHRESGAGAAPRTKDFHPDDRSTDPEDAPGGPWRSENIGDEDRSWGPTVWDSRVDAEGYGVIGVSRFFFETLPLAEAIRDVLNRDALNRLKGDET